MVPGAAVAEKGLSDAAGAPGAGAAAPNGAGAGAAAPNGEGAAGAAACQRETPVLEGGIAMVRCDRFLLHILNTA